VIDASYRVFLGVLPSSVSVREEPSPLALPYLQRMSRESPHKAIDEERDLMRCDYASRLAKTLAER
jgi:hypothetical protein